MISFQGFNKMGSSRCLGVVSRSKIPLDEKSYHQTVAAVDVGSKNVSKT